MHHATHTPVHNKSAMLLLSTGTHHMHSPWLHHLLAFACLGLTMATTTTTTHDDYDYYCYHQCFFTMRTVVPAYQIEVAIEVAFGKKKKHNSVHILAVQVQRWLCPHKRITSNDHHHRIAVARLGWAEGKTGYAQKKPPARWVHPTSGTNQTSCVTMSHWHNNLFSTIGCDRNPPVFFCLPADHKSHMCSFAIKAPQHVWAPPKEASVEVMYNPWIDQ